MLLFESTNDFQLVFWLGPIFGAVVSAVIHLFVLVPRADNGSDDGREMNRNGDYDVAKAETMT